MQTIGRTSGQEAEKAPVLQPGHCISENRAEDHFSKQGESHIYPHFTTVSTISNSEKLETT